jgi:hypothetical protein
MIVSLFAAVYYDTQNNEDSAAKKIPHGNRFEGCLVCREVSPKGLRQYDARVIIVVSEPGW